MKPDSTKPEDSSEVGGSRQTEKVLRWIRENRAESDFSQTVRRRAAARARGRAFAGAGAVVLALLLVLIWKPGRNQRGDVPTGPRTAEIVAPRTLTLSDGTTVELKDSATVTEQFTPALRRVHLESGEAHFQVMKNPDRPFVVEAAGVEVRAVGTGFVVQLGQNSVEVVVTEGRVAVQRAGRNLIGPSSAAQETEGVLGAGQRVLISSESNNAQLSRLAAVDLAARQAWRTPQIELSRTPLGEILQYVNQQAKARGKRQLMVAPDSLDLLEVKLTGFLSADNTEGLVRMLRTSFPIEVEAGSDTVTVRRANR